MVTYTTFVSGSDSIPLTKKDQKLLATHRQPPTSPNALKLQDDINLLRKINEPGELEIISQKTQVASHI